jgi:hypothetical protein
MQVSLVMEANTSRKQAFRSELPGILVLIALQTGTNAYISLGSNG